MNRYVLTLQYDGTNYCGWQVQPNGIAVQQVVIDALESVIGKTADGVHGCSRTDSGVHADRFICHFDSDTAVPPQGIVLGTNTKLPPDIRILDCKIVDKDFHARYSCKGKTYEYRIRTHPIADAFSYLYEYQYSGNLDCDAMNEAAKYFIGKHDFSCFCSSGSAVQDKVRTVFRADVVKKGDQIVFSVTGDGFLYNMVRIMTGSLISVGEGKIKPKEIAGIIEQKDRSLAGATAPAYGLHLVDILY